MSKWVDQCIHLDVDIVQEIHAEAIAEFGGSSGVRDLTLLESAVAAPQATIGGKSPYLDLIEVGGAYIFYIRRNHPFIDGNKRAALGRCIVFFDLNGVKVPPDRPEWEALVLAVASSAVGRDEMTEALRKFINNCN